jgi:hypothetical protein
MKGIGKQKRKEEEKEKYEFGPRGNDSAQQQNQPVAHLSIPEPVPVFPLSLSDMWTPHVIIKLQPKNSPATVSSQ